MKVKEIIQKGKQIIRDFEASKWTLLMALILISWGMFFLSVYVYSVKQLDLKTIIYANIYLTIIFFIGLGLLTVAHRNFKNAFVMASTILFLFITIFGIMSVLLFYSSDYPTPLSNENGVLGYCYGINYKEAHVKGDTMYCTIDTSGFNNSISRIDSNFVIDSVSMPMERDLVIYNNNKNEAAIRIVIKNEGLHNLFLTVHYGKNETVDSIEGRKFNVIAYEKYTQRRYERVGLFALVISLAITVSSVGVKNFMDIWENAKNKKRVSTHAATYAQ